MVVLATHTPFTIVLPGPQPRAICEIMPSGLGIDAGVIACANVAMDKAKPAATINLIILILPCVGTIHSGAVWQEAAHPSRRSRQILVGYWQGYILPSSNLTMVPG
jgi:hypothetical protein